MSVANARREYRTWMIDSRRWDNYRPRSGDIIVATYPKCGTTWMKQIVSLLIFQSPEPRNISEIGPWIDCRISPPVEILFAALDAQMHRRFLKAHLPYDGLPSFEEVRYIHVARDGRDACLSYHNQITRFRPEARAALDRIGLEDEALRRPYPQIPDHAAEYFRLWMREGIGGAADGTPFLSYFDLERTYWAARRRSNVLMVLATSRPIWPARCAAWRTSLVLMLSKRPSPNWSRRQLSTKCAVLAVHSCPGF
jgi:aryl sulfotransferase